MRWSASVLVLMLSSALVFAAPMWLPSSSSQESPMEQYRRKYDYHLARLGMQPSAVDSRQLLRTPHLEVAGLLKYMGLAEAPNSPSARLRAAGKAVRLANALGEKIKSEIEGPLHPNNIGRQIRANLQHSHAAYEKLLNGYNHPDNHVAYAEIANHPNINRMWSVYASLFIDLVNEGIALVVTRG